MMERDRFVRGFYAGSLAGFIQDIWSFVSLAMGTTSLRMADWAAIVIYGRGGPFSTPELLFGIIAHIVFSGFLGIVFVYLIPVITSRHFTLKGLLFGWATWFAIYGISLLFKIEPTLNLPLMTPISDFTGAGIYGLVLAWVVYKLTPGVKQE